MPKEKDINLTFDYNETAQVYMTDAPVTIEQWNVVALEYRKSSREACDLPKILEAPDVKGQATVTAEQRAEFVLRLNKMWKNNGSQFRELTPEEQALLKDELGFRLVHIETETGAHLCLGENFTVFTQA